MGENRTKIDSRKRCTYGEQILFGLVENGTIRIDKEGRVWKGEKRTEHQNQLGYWQTRVMVKGKRYHTGSHRLVFRLFKGEIPTGFVVNHIDGNKSNNKPENLEAISYSDNSKHAFRIGLKDEHGEKNPASKLSNEEVVRIRKMYATHKYLQIDLAKIFGVAFQTISKIVRGERRKKQAGRVSNHDHRFCSSIHGPDGRFISKKKTEVPK